MLGYVKMSVCASWNVFGCCWCVPIKSKRIHTPQKYLTRILAHARAALAEAYKSICRRVRPLKFVRALAFYR